MPAADAVLCAHSGQPVVMQRSLHDCMLCAFAMFAGRSYEEMEAAARSLQPGYDPAGVAMTHSLVRRIAHNEGLVLLSSIYMNWAAPGIVGVASLTIENCGHALFWDGETLIDPGATGLYHRAHVDAHAMEFTQRAGDLGALILLEQQLAPATRATSLEEFF